MASKATATARHFVRCGVRGRSAGHTTPVLRCVRSVHTAVSRHASNDWRGSLIPAGMRTAQPTMATTYPTASVPVSHVSYAGSLLSGTTPMPVFQGFVDDVGSDMLVQRDPATLLFEPQVDAVDASAVGESDAAEPSMYLDSTLRKRRAKMNKHKRRKWRRKMRDLGGENLKKKK